MKLLSRAAALFLLFLPLTVSATPCIDVNTAPEKELEKIKHIGEARAKKIIENREKKLFSSLDELDILTGIGPVRISDIKEQGLACALVTPTPEKEADQKAASSLIASGIPEEALAQIKPGEALNSLTLFLAAVIIAIFSGFAILFLKRKAKI